MISKKYPKVTTSVRLSRLEDLENVVRDFGFKDRTHFFQLVTDALLAIPENKKSRLDWPPRFILRNDE
jgi:hypothetical protein